MKDPVITRMEEDLKDLGRSIHTRRTYVQTATRLQRHFGTSPGHRGSCVLKAIFRRVLAGGGWQTGCMEFPQESNVAVLVG